MFILATRPNLSAPWRMVDEYSWSGAMLYAYEAALGRPDLQVAIFDGRRDDWEKSPPMAVFCGSLPGFLAANGIVNVDDLLARRDELPLAWHAECLALVTTPLSERDANFIKCHAAIRSAHAADEFVTWLEMQLTDGCHIRIGDLVIARMRGAFYVAGQLHNRGALGRYVAGEMADYILSLDRRTVNAWLSGRL